MCEISASRAPDRDFRCFYPCGIFLIITQKHKVWVLVFLKRAEHFETKIEQVLVNFSVCKKTASSKATPFKKRCYKYFIKRVG